MIDYKCSECGITGHKLWRQSAALATDVVLLCAVCAEKDQGRAVDLERPSDQIGDLLPALPVEGEDTFWGYTSASDEACLLWHGLPAFKDPTREIAWLRAWNGRWQRRLQHYMNEAWNKS